MKALTLWQPWATLMALGDKTIETRPPWAMRLAGLVGTDLAIHAGARRPTEAERVVGDWTVAWHPSLGEFFLDHDHREQLEEMPLGAVVAVVRVAAVLPMVTPGHVTEPCILVADPSNPFRYPASIGESGIWRWHGPHDRGANGIGWTDVTADMPYGHYEPGRVAIVTDDLRRLDEGGIPCAGHQQVWNLPADVEAQVRDALGMAAAEVMEPGRLPL